MKTKLLWVEVESDRGHHPVPEELPQIITVEGGKEARHLLASPASALYTSDLAGS